MIVFWIASIVLCLLTLWALWRPLRSSSMLKLESIQQRNIAIARERLLEIESEYEAGEIDLAARDRAKYDLEMTLADELASSSELKGEFRTTSKLSSFVIVILVPFLAYGLYSLNTNFQDKPAQRTSVHTEQIPSLEEIFKRLEQRVRDNPKDQQGLYLLAQSYARVGRYEESAQRYQQLVAMVPPDANLYASLADSQAMANGGAFNQEIASNLQSALQLDPNHTSALWLSGLANQQLGKPETALRQWLKLKSIITENVEASAELDILISTVTSELGERATEITKQALSVASNQKSVPTQAQPEESAQASLNVSVSLSPELREQAKESDTVFIFAKAKTGPPMPLAASRHPVSELPIHITLDDSMAMLPQMKISNFDEVIVGARISASGQAIAQSGDLESELIATSIPNSESINIVISKRKP